MFHARYLTSKATTRFILPQLAETAARIVASKSQWTEFSLKGFPTESIEARRTSSAMRDLLKYEANINTLQGEVERGQQTQLNETQKNLLKDLHIGLNNLDALFRYITTGTGVEVQKHNEQPLYHVIRQRLTRLGVAGYTIDPSGKKVDLSPQRRSGPKHNPVR